MRNLIFIIVFFIPACLYSQIPEWIKLRECPSSVNDNSKLNCFTDVTSDSDGNIYSAGFSRTEANPDNSANQQNGSMIVSKMDNMGNPKWISTFPIVAGQAPLKHDEYIYSTTYVPKGGNLSDFVCVGGESNGKAFLATFKGTNGGFTYQANITSLNGTSRVSCIHSYGTKIYVIGYFSGTLEIRNPGQTTIKKSLSSIGNKDIFVACFTIGWNFTDAIQLSGLKDQQAFDLKIDNNENLYISVATNAEVKVNNQTVIYPYSNQNGNSADLCLMKFNKLVFANCTKLAEGPSTLFLNDNRFQDLTGGGFNSTTYPFVFPIAFDKTYAYCYFAITSRLTTNTTVPILGKLNLSNNSINLKETGPIFNNSNNSNPSTSFITDVEISTCDSLYVSARTTAPHQMGGGRHTICSINTNTFALSSNLSGSQFSNVEKINIDKNRNIICAGFFDDEISYNNDQFSYVSVSSFINTPNSCTNQPYRAREAFTLKYNPCQKVVRQKKSMISGYPLICKENHSSFDYYICNSCPSSTAECIYKFLPIGNNPDPQSYISSNYDPIAKKVTILNFGSYSKPFKLYVECRYDCCKVDYDEVTIYPAIPLNLNFTYSASTNTSTNTITITASAAPLNNPFIHYGWYIFQADPACKIKGEDTGTTNDYIIYSEWADWDYSTNGIGFSYSGLPKGGKYVIYFCAVYEYPSPSSTEICGWRDVRECIEINKQGQLIKKGQTNSSENKLKLVPTSKKKQ